MLRLERNAWSMVKGPRQAQIGTPRVVLPGTAGMRVPTVIRLRPCMTMSTPPPPPPLALSGLGRLPSPTEEHGSSALGDGRSVGLPSKYRRGGTLALAVLAVSVVGSVMMVRGGGSGGLTGREVYTQPFVGDHSRPNPRHAPPRVVVDGVGKSARWGKQQFFFCAVKSVSWLWTPFITHRIDHIYRSSTDHSMT